MKIYKKFYQIKLEPYQYKCPRCNVTMTWYGDQGPFGGWKCPVCGLQIDHKPGY